MAEWSKALRSGRSPLLWAGVRISLLTTGFFYVSLSLSPPPYRSENLLSRTEQSGAVEACWAHNPEVRRSKLRSANYFAGMNIAVVGVWNQVQNALTSARFSPISAEDSALDF